MPSSAWNTTSSTSAAGRRFGCDGSSRCRKGEDRDRDDHEHETAGDETMEHFAEGLVLDDRAIRERRVGLRRIGSCLAGGQVTITARPVRAAETGVIQAHPRAEHDDAERDQRAQQTQLPEAPGREQRRGRVHGVE
jgi:hypothetical protein